MELARRDLLLSSLLVLGPGAAIAAPPPTPLAQWLELAKVLGDVADGISRLADVVGKITVNTVHGIDWFRGRTIRSGLLVLSRRVTSLLVDQEAIKTALDGYGDLWRKAHRRGGQPAPPPPATAA